MKQKDYLLVVVIGIVSVVFSLVISNLVIASPEKFQQEAYTVDKISDDFSEVDKRFFNENSINPTQLIRIGESMNQEPFNSSQNPF